MAISRRQHTAIEVVPACVSYIIEKYTVVGANTKRSFSEILDGAFLSRDRADGKKSSAPLRPLGATCLLVATNVAGLPGCAYLQSLGPETKSDNDDGDVCELLQWEATGMDSQGHEVAHEVAERVAGMAEKVKSDHRFVGLMIDVTAGDKTRLGMRFDSRSAESGSRNIRSTRGSCFGGHPEITGNYLCGFLPRVPVARGLDSVK
jgi:hypothetical protein